jgi:hypothetical protein
MTRPRVKAPGANRPSVPLQAQTIEAQMGYPPVGFQNAARAADQR